MRQPILLFPFPEKETEAQRSNFVKVKQLAPGGECICVCAYITDLPLQR